MTNLVPPEGTVLVTSRDEVAAFLARDKPLHLYELGDLDAFFWDATTWYGLRTTAGALSALVLIYSGMRVPTVIALDRTPLVSLHDLLGRLRPVLPHNFYAHLSADLGGALAPEFCLDQDGPHLKMLLTDPDRVREVQTHDVAPLTPNDRESLTAFYDDNYPGNWFDARMLETGQYVGIREAGAMVCVAGVHVYSPAYGVAALGNIATDRRHRRCGLARRATAAICQSLLQHVDTIGLNVKADNRAAIDCYEGLGFETVAEYDEFRVGRR